MCHVQRVMLTRAVAAQVTRQVISFLLSHIGLLSLVVGYCIMGAAIFEARTICYRFCKTCKC